MRQKITSKVHVYKCAMLKPSTTFSYLSKIKKCSLAKSIQQNTSFHLPTISTVQSTYCPLKTVVTKHSQKLVFFIIILKARKMLSNFTIIHPGCCLGFYIFLSNYMCGIVWSFSHLMFTKQFTIPPQHCYNQVHCTST